LQRRVELQDFAKTDLYGEGNAMSRLRDSDYYHRRAEELRLTAREPCSLDNRDTLLYFAADLDELADEAAAAEREQSQKR
jgi:hypothetical protein